MATILAFRRDPGRLPAVLPSGHSARLFFFTGVRYERATVEPQVSAAVRKKPRKSQLARPSA